MLSKWPQSSKLADVAHHTVQLLCSGSAGKVVDNRLFHAAVLESEDERRSGYDSLGDTV